MAQNSFIDSARQKEHYEAIHDRYEAHYYDPTAMRYRRTFFYDWLLRNIDLNGKLVADLACGSGHNSLLLREKFPAVQTVGYDISAKACEAYRAFTGSEAHEIDLTKPADLSTHYDAVIIIGGLHHCVGNLNATLTNIASMLKSGGQFIMVEPNQLYFLEALRKWWYRRDIYFDADTEHALDHDAVFEIAKDKFKCQDIRYIGGPAYFMVLNSLLFRLPTALKPYIAPPLFLLEWLYNAIMPAPQSFPLFLAKWQRL